MKPLNTAQASDVLGIFSEATLKQARTKAYDGFAKTIPYHKVGRRIYYKASELVEWLEANGLGGES